MVAPALNLLDRDDWHLIDIEWDRSIWVTQFYPVARAYVISKEKNWIARTSRVEFDDVISAGTTALFLAATQWPAFADRTSTSITDLRAFWGYARKRIDYDLIDFKRRLIGRSPAARALNAAYSLDHSVNADGSTLLAETTPFDDRSLQLSIIDSIKALTKAEQTVLALSYFEKLNRPEAAEIMGIDLRQLRTIHTDAAIRLLAMSQTTAGTSQPVPTATHSYTPTASLTQWVRTQHNTSVDGWLSGILSAYADDVGLLLHILTKLRHELDKGARLKQAAMATA